MAWSATKLGLVAASEYHVEVHSDARRSSRRIPVIYCHGFLSEGRTIRRGAGTIQGGVFYQQAAMMAERVGPVLSADLGGGTTWAIDTVVAPSTGRIDAAIAWAGTNLGTRTDKVVLWGDSMGALNAAVWAFKQPQRVAALWLRGPIIRFQGFYDANPGLQAAIDAAWGNHTNWVNGLPTHDPAQNLAVLSYLGDRTRLDYTGQDELIPADWAPAYAAATGASAFFHHGDHASNVYVDATEAIEWLHDKVRTIH